MANKFLEMFERDLLFLNQNMVPMEPSGKRIDELDYEGSSDDEDERLDDCHVEQLAQSLMQNDTFQGPIDLSKNNLTDQSAVYLQQAISRPGAKNITELNLDKNYKLSEKSGIYLGDALIENTEHPINKLSFKGICLGEDGLLRIIEAANKNQNIKKLHVGIVNGNCLSHMARSLKNNKSLEKLMFTECEQEPWTDQGKSEFITMIRGHKTFQKVSFNSADGSDNKLFKKEIEFFVKKIKNQHEVLEEIEERKESCSNTHLFNDLLKMIENKEDHEKMPVRKFFDNTFDKLINDAVFALMKKQRKTHSPNIHTIQGSIKFVAQFLQDNLPDYELDNMSESEEENEGSQINEEAAENEEESPVKGEVKPEAANEVNVKAE